MPRSSSLDCSDCSGSSEFILKLNDDCLLKIFEYLSLYDQINLATISHRFSDLFLLYSSSRTRRKIFVQIHENFDNEEELEWMESNNLVELIKLLPFDEIKIKRLIKNDLFKILQALSLKNFSNLHIENNCIEKFPRCGNLTKLILHNCGLNDGFIKTLSENQKNLKYLDLSHNVDLYGDHLKNFQQLETLSLKYCYEVKEKNLIEVFKSNLSLKNVNVKYCHDFFNSAFVELPCNLNSLSFSYNSKNKINFANKTFPNLKYLAIGRSDEVPFPIVSILKNIKSPYLEKLKINFVSNSEVNTAWSSLLEEKNRFQNISELVLNIYPIQYHELYRFDWSHLKNISSLKSLKLRLYPKEVDNDNMVNFIHETFIENFEIDYQNNDGLYFGRVLHFIAKVFLSKFRPTITIKNMVHSVYTYVRSHLLCKCSEENKKNVILTTFDLNTEPRERSPYSHYLPGVSNFLNDIDSTVQEFCIRYFAPMDFSKLYYVIEDMLQKEHTIKIRIEIHSTNQLLDSFLRTTLYESAKEFYDIKTYAVFSYKSIDEIMFLETGESDNNHSLEICSETITKEITY